MVPVVERSVAEEMSRRSEPDALFRNLEPAHIQELLFDWRVWRRPKQATPPGDWTIWLILAGRGFGKTRTGAEWVREEVDRGRTRHIALVGPTCRCNDRGSCLSHMPRCRNCYTRREPRWLQNETPS